MKATRKLIPAIALLLVSAVLLSTASYAWFTTNKVVETQMTVSVTAPQNLQISVDGGTTYKISHNFGATYTKLTPVSSADGKNFVLVKGLTLDQDGVLTSANIGKVGEGKELGGSITTLTSSQLAPIAENSPTSEYSSGSGAAKETYAIIHSFKLKSTQDIATGKFVIDVALASAADGEGVTDETTEAYQDAVRVFVFQGETLVYAEVRNTEGVKVCYPIVPGASDTYTVATEAAKSVDQDASVAFTGNVAQDWSIVIWIEGNDPDCVSANIDETPNLDVKVTFSIDEGTGSNP